MQRLEQDALGGDPARPPQIILDLDPDLGEGVPRREWALAREVCRGHLIDFAGLRELIASAADSTDLLGLLLVEGVLCREVTLGDRVLFELLGPGDILQLPAAAEVSPLVGPPIFTEIAPCVLIGLQGRFVEAAGRWPSLLRQVFIRLETQRNRLAAQAVITHLPRADDRLLLALWHLCQRWGRVTPRGNVLPFRLTHDIFAQLIAARRPTASAAVNGLEAEGAIARLEDGSWLITPLGQHKVVRLARGAPTGRSLGAAIRQRQAKQGLWPGPTRSSPRAPRPLPRGNQA